MHIMSAISLDTGQAYGTSLLYDPHATLPCGHNTTCQRGGGVQDLAKFLRLHLRLRLCPLDIESLHGFTKLHIRHTPIFILVHHLVEDLFDVGEGDWQREVLHATSAMVAARGCPRRRRAQNLSAGASSSSRSPRCRGQFHLRDEGSRQTGVDWRRWSSCSHA